MLLGHLGPYLTWDHSIWITEGSLVVIATAADVAETACKLDAISIHLLKVSSIGGHWRAPVLRTVITILAIDLQRDVVIFELMALDGGLLWNLLQLIPNEHKLHSIDIGAIWLFEHGLELLSLMQMHKNYFDGTILSHAGDVEVQYLKLLREIVDFCHLGAVTDAINY